MSYHIPDPHKTAFEQFATKWDAEQAAESARCWKPIDEWLSSITDGWVIPLIKLVAWSAVIAVIVVSLLANLALTIGLLLLGILIDRKHR